MKFGRRVPDRNGHGGHPPIPHRMPISPTYLLARPRSPRADPGEPLWSAAVVEVTFVALLVASVVWF